VNLSDDPKTVHDKLARMMTDPRRVRRTDPGDPKDCPAFPSARDLLHGRGEGRAHAVLPHREIGCLDCKKVMIRHVSPSSSRSSNAGAKLAEQRRTSSTTCCGAARAARREGAETLAEAKHAMGL
jgi:tryptophanyl-tRNA synthetase